MKITVDNHGWAATPGVMDEPTPSEHALPPDPALKPSGVYLKVSASKMAQVEDPETAQLASAPTEPSPPSDEAMAESAFRLPSPPSVPRDLLSDDGTRVA